MSPGLKDRPRDKEPAIWSIAPDASVFDAIRLMAEKDVGLLLVMDDPNGLPVGVISERDYARRVILRGLRSKAAFVADIMTRDVTFGTSDQTVRDGMSLMTEGHFRHLPIVEDGRVIGVVSLGGLAKAVLADRESLSERLDTCIAG